MPDNHIEDEDIESMEAGPVPDPSRFRGSGRQVLQEIEQAKWDDKMSVERLNRALVKEMRIRKRCPHGPIRPSAWYRRGDGDWRKEMASGVHLTTGKVRVELSLADICPEIVLYFDDLQDRGCMTITMPLEAAKHLAGVILDKIQAVALCEWCGNQIGNRQYQLSHGYCKDCFVHYQRRLEKSKQSSEE